MIRFGWFCFWLGIALIVIGLPVIIVLSPILVSKVIVAALVNIIIGWGLAHRKPKLHDTTCPNCNTNNSIYFKYCGNCGIQLREKRN